MKDKAKTKDERIAKAQGEFTNWLNTLTPYFERFDENYKQYTAYSTTKGTESTISDPLAPEQIERVILRLFEREPKFFTLAKGNNLPKEITDIISSTASYYWTCPERLQISGVMRSKLKLWGRELLVTGNLGIETYYNSKSKTPDARMIPIDDIIFNPTKTLRTSDKYYIRQHVSLKYIQDMVETSKNGVTTGIFKADAVKTLEEKYKDSEDRPKPASENKINRSGGSIQEVEDEILLVTCYENDGTYVRYADWEVILEDSKNDILDDDPLDFAMDIEIPKQPYGFSLLDSIIGITHSKDLILNQIIDFGSKALNPPLFVDPSLAPVNRATLRNAFKIGGIVFANPQQVEHKQMSPLPPVGFELLNYLQTRAEQIGTGPYLGGTPNQASDKTQGTASGINTMVQQAQAPVQDRQMNIEESIIEPMINKWMKYAGALMGEDEIKYVLISGQAPKWVAITKGILTGKILLKDLVTAEIVKPEEVQEIVDQMVSEGKDPNTDFIFDVDWIIRVETGSLAQVDTEKEIANLEKWAAFRQLYQVPTDFKKITDEYAMKIGIKNPEQYDLQTPDGQQIPNLTFNGGSNGGQSTAGANPAPQQVGQDAGVPVMARPGM